MGSGGRNAQKAAQNYVTVHSYNFFDLEGPTGDNNKDEDDDFFKAGKAFATGESVDLLHFINADSDLAHNATRAIDAYND
jgi:hypothetical protein